jgi:hypothetical protein
MIGDRIDDLCIHDHFPECNEIRDKLSYFSVLVQDIESWLLCGKDTSFGKLHDHCILIWLFMEAVPNPLSTSIAQPTTWYTSSLQSRSSEFIFASLSVHSRF